MAERSFIMKKKISVLLALIMIICSLQIFVSAVPSTTVSDSFAIGNTFTAKPKQFKGSVNDSYYASLLGLSSSAYQSLKNDIEKGVADFKLTFNVEKYNFPITGNTFQAIYYIATESPLGFYIGNSISYSVLEDPDTGVQSLVSVTLKSMYDETTARTVLKQCDDIAESMIADLYPLSDVAKALLVHDRIIAACEYDISDNPVYESSTIYGALILKCCTCIGYSQAYQFLLGKLGVDCCVCDSVLLNHEWNIVTIDGQEYHVDLTWDDPLYDTTGRVNHDNFLLSTNALIATGHVANNQIDYYNAPSNTKYNNYFWKNSNTCFQTLGGSVYYIDNSSEELRRWDGGTSTTLLTSVNGIWRSGKDARWLGNYARLGADEDFLYYSLSDAIYRYDTFKNTSTEIYTNTRANFSIYGFKAENGNFIIDLSPYSIGPNTTATTKSDYGVVYKYPSGKIILGDVDGDKEITSHDRMLLARYIAGWGDVGIDLDCADINRNSKITAKDRMILSRYLDSWNGYEAYFG